MECSNRPFQIDHIVALVNGGKDTDANCQVLCSGGPDAQANNCHAKKTALDLGFKPRVRVGLDGWPVK